MTPKDVSRVGGRRTVTVLAVAALLFGSLVVTQTVSAGAPVTLSSDKTSATVLENDNVVFALTLSNAATEYDWQPTKLYGSWLSGTEWMYLFLDEEGEALENNTLDIEQGTSAAVLLTVYCVSPCAGGSSNTLAVYAKPDPR